MTSTIKDIELIRHTTYLLDFAEYLPRDVILQAGDANAYPTTIGERIVAYVLHPLLTHEWESDAAEELADEMLDELSQLDTGVDKPASWEALFDAKNRCRAALGVTQN